MIAKKKIDILSEKGELKMNKYQENLDFIIKNSCPQKTICRECNINNFCNCLAKEHIDSLQELVENHFDLVEKYKELEKALDKARNQEAYKWVPTQLFGVKLPREDGRYLITLNDGFIATANYIENKWELWADAGEVIAWLPLPKPYKEK